MKKLAAKKSRAKAPILYFDVAGGWFSMQQPGEAGHLLNKSNARVLRDYLNDYLEGRKIPRTPQYARALAGARAANRAVR